MQDDLEIMLGMQLNDVAKSPFLQSLDVDPRTEKIEDRLYMELPASGVAFIATPDGTVMAIQLHTEGYQGYNGFEGKLPRGIAFSDSRRVIQHKLGKPSTSGGGEVIPLFGKAAAWERFDQNEWSLHIQYADGDGAINLVTLMLLDFTPK